MERVVLVVIGALLIAWGCGIHFEDFGPAPPSPWPPVVGGGLMIFAAALWRPEKK